MDISENICRIKENIAAAAKKSGRKAADVKLIAVTKTRTAEAINKAIELGISIIGENRVQELCEKYLHLLPCEVHLIGQLQTNKVRQAIGKVKLIHSLDRISLAEEINRISEREGIVTDCLVQINIGREQQKGGVDPDDAERFLDELREYSNIRVKGLMTVPPVCVSQEARRYFEELRLINESINKNRNNDEKLTEMSMGMTADYMEAIGSGATMVRIGTGIFGDRVNQ